MRTRCRNDPVLESASANAPAAEANSVSQSLGWCARGPPLSTSRGNRASLRSSVDTESDQRHSRAQIPRRQTKTPRHGVGPVLEHRPNVCPASCQPFADRSTPRQFHMHPTSHPNDRNSPPAYLKQSPRDLLHYRSYP
jgi:hypothetical protein